TEVYHARIGCSFQSGLREIDAIWRKLLAMSAQIRRWKSDLFRETCTVHDRAKDSVLMAQHLGRLREVTSFDSATDRRAAHGLAVRERNGGNSNDVEVELRAQLPEKGKISAPVFSERPFMSDTDFTQWF